MNEIMQVVWFLCLLVISLYHVFVFQVRISSSSIKTSTLPGVSVIIAVRNGSGQLKGNLPDIIQQDYPIFEVIIVDDHSDARESKNLEEIISSRPDIRLMTSVMPGKKNALLTGVENAKYEFILCTDADCKPAGTKWIRTMIECSRDHSTVIGYSPYQKLPGVLNLLIRFETVMTGIQYLSWAFNGKPYMGVGRNMLYPKALFLKTKPFNRHIDVPYGDDDLGIQKFSESSVIDVCVDPKAHVISMPVTSWVKWLRQKHRHLSAGHYYTHAFWWQPGVYGIALIGHWFLLSFMFETLTWWKWIPVFAISLFIRWQTYLRWTNRLGDKDSAAWFPVLEIIYAAYLAFMGTITTLSKKKTWN